MYLKHGTSHKILTSTYHLPVTIGTKNDDVGEKCKAKLYFGPLELAFQHLVVNFFFHPATIASERHLIGFRRQKRELAADALV